VKELVSIRHCIGHPAKPDDLKRHRQAMPQRPAGQLVHIELELKGPSPKGQTGYLSPTLSKLRGQVSAFHARC
jgi:hypothetical protein